MLETTATGVIQLDWRGRIAAVNERARGILMETGGLVDRAGFLRARASVENIRLQRMLARALPRFGAQGVSGSMVVTRLSRLSRLVLHVLPVEQRDGDFPALQVAAIVLVVDPDSQPPLDTALVASALGLSPAESRVAVMLAEGSTVREVAAAIGRSEHTIRWHIRRIFDKHGLTRLIQLVQLLRSISRPSATVSQAS